MRITIALFSDGYISSRIFIHGTNKEYGLFIKGYTSETVVPFYSWKKQFASKVQVINLDLDCKLDELSKEYITTAYPELLL